MIRILLALLLTTNVFADTLPEFLKESTPPSGLVIEIIEDDEDDWEWIIPQIKQTIKQARAKFPQVPIAIVSHGKEEMAFIKDDENQETKNEIQSIIQNSQVDFHVCAVHASWYQYTPEDFVSFVDVSATGPAEIASYEEMGYFLIRLTK